MKTPNFIVNLTPSYNTRGTNPQTNIVAGLDQRRVNCFYEQISNSTTNSNEFILSKRPGIYTPDNTAFSFSTETTYLTGWSGGSSVSSAFANLTCGKQSNFNLIVSETSGTVDTTLISSATEWPVYISSAVIGATYYTIIQTLSNSNNAQRVFYSSAAGTWTEITDTDFTGLYHFGKMEFIDGYAFILDSTNKIYQSDLNSLSAWGASNFLQKVITSDYPQGLARFQNQLLAFGSETVEVFYNAGNATGSVLGRLPHLHARVGLADMAHPRVDGKTHYYCTIENKLFFIGREAGRLPISSGYSSNAALFSYDGSKFEKVEDAILSRILSTNTIYGIWAFPFYGQNAVAIQLTNPTSAATTTHRWIMYFPNTKAWFEWNSTEFMPTNNGSVFLGTKNNEGRLYFFPPDTELYQDQTDGVNTNYDFSVQFEIPRSNGLWRSIPYCGVDGDTARSATSLTIEKSTDDYQNWVNVGTIDMTRNRKCKYGLGTFSNAALRLSYSGANPIRLQNFYATIDE